MAHVSRHLPAPGLLGTGTEGGVLFISAVMPGPRVDGYKVSNKWLLNEAEISQALEIEGQVEMWLHGGCIK